MDMNDITQKTEKELHELLQSSRGELEGHRFQSHEHQLKKVHRIREIKRDIARILTALRQKQQVKIV